MAYFLLRHNYQITEGTDLYGLVSGNDLVYKKAYILIS